VEEVSGNDFWTALFGGGDGEPLILRAGLAPKDLAAYVNAQEQALERGPFLADIANGFVYASSGKGEPDETLAWIERLRKAALNLGGYCLAVSLPAGLEGKVDRWGYRPETLDLMRRLKQRWDPAGILGDVYPLDA
jgi:glycolate oxidase FAD binding subunit